MADVEIIPLDSAQWADVRREFTVAQAGLCAICGEDVTDAPQLDHCHVTGFIRGVLCVGCNTRLGWYEGRRKAIESYLTRSCEYAAYAGPSLNTAPRLRKPERRSRSEYWRAYWQGKHLE